MGRKKKQAEVMLTEPDPKILKAIELLRKYLKISVDVEDYPDYYGNRISISVKVAYKKDGDREIILAEETETAFVADNLPQTCEKCGESV